ncbi:MAG: Gfo/Idh/MocA family oxidoreductase [Pelolinea sp.]|nr:Gfo/Idh/MocA family oxidoreductase [Pelolinea sp.]
MKIAIFGAGGITQRAYLPILSTWPGIEIIGIYSRTQASVDKTCAKFHLSNGTTSAQELVEMKPDAAFVLTNDQTHFEFVKILLKAGIDVFVEKPMAQNSVEAQILAQLSKEENKILMVGFNRRFTLQYKKAKEVFKGKKIQLAIIQKSRVKATHTNLYNNYLDDTIHQIDLMRFYCGNVVPLNTYYEQQDGKIVGAVSVCSLCNGGIGVIMTSLQAGSWQESVVLHGDNFSVEVNAFEKLTIKNRDHEQILGTDRVGSWIPDLKERGFYGELEHFFDCVNSRQQPQTNAFDAVQTHQLLKKMVDVAGLKSIEPPTNGWDEIPRWD